jgi:hypothetical protein
MLVTLDLKSLTAYARREIRGRLDDGTTALPGGHEGEAYRCIDGAIDNLMAAGAYRHAALVLFARVGMQQFTADEADRIFEVLVNTDVVASMIHDWAVRNGEVPGEVDAGREGT